MTAMPRLGRRAAAGAAALALLGALAASPALAASVASGVVRYEGPAIQPLPLRMNADPKCAELHGGKPVLARDRLVAADGGVANVFVYLKEAPAGTGPFTAPAEPVRLGQKDCFYEPHVLGILVGQKLEVHNEDATLHNVRCLAKANRPFNLGQPAQSPPRTKFFTSPEEAVKFKCDVHPWMSSYVFVMTHPFFAVTDASGKFTIPGLPDGKYVLHAWHETFGALEQEVEVKAGAAPVAFVFRPASP
jgi:hypothetical protein